MMTLQEAIAEVKAVPLGDASWPALKAVLQAVASGDLLPKADHDLAEALAEVARLRGALIAARQVVYQSSIDRTQPEDAEAALQLIDAALTTKDTP
jgi:hypothetical protein